MSYPHIQNRFAYHAPTGAYQNVSDTDWRNWQWQLASAKNSITPYYKNILAENAEQISQLYQNEENLLILSDVEMLAKIEIANKSSDGVTEISLPWFSQIPQRITDTLIALLEKRDQVIIHFAINHPKECTLELFEACNKLADAGFILNNHMTLLNGINDSAEAVKELNLKLLMMRVRPYSIYVDAALASEKNGVNILESLRGWTSGLAVPHLLIKQSSNSFVTSLPNYIKKNDGENFIFRNYKNLDYEYINS